MPPPFKNFPAKKKPKRPKKKGRGRDLFWKGKIPCEKCVSIKSKGG